MNVPSVCSSFFLSGVLALLSVPALSAAIVASSVTGDDVIDLLSSPPADVSENMFTGDANSSIDVVRVFQEQPNLLLPQAVSVDIETAKLPGLPVTYTGGGGAPPPEVAGILPAGSRIESYFFHLDEPAGELGRVEGSVTFNSDILAVIFATDTLDATHALLGAPGTTYPSAGSDNHGTLEDTDDFITFVDLRTLEFKLSQQTAMDQFRVITAIPEPSNFILAAIGLGLLGARRRRQA